MAGVPPPLQIQQYVAAPHPTQPGQVPHLLGEGQYRVYLYADPPNNRLVAIKRIYLVVPNATRATALFVELDRELGIHHKLNHPLIVKMLDVFISDDNYLNIVLEYVEHGTLINLINTRAPAPSEGVVRYFFQQLICTLDYLHAKDVVHRDIKLENTLCKAMQPALDLPPQGAWLLKVADFGLSRTGELAGTNVGTQQYKAPEVYEFNVNGNNNAHGGQHNPNEPRYESAPVDVWSAGVLLYAALIRQYPFHTENIHSAQDVETYLRGPRPLPYPQPLSPNCIHLIEKMLAPQAADRITLPQIIQHPFFLQDIGLQDPNLQQLKQLCLNLPSPCALNQQQLAGVIAQVHARLAP